MWQVPKWMIDFQQKGDKLRAERDTLRAALQQIAALRPPAGWRPGGVDVDMAAICDQAQEIAACALNATEDM